MTSKSAASHVGSDAGPQKAWKYLALLTTLTAIGVHSYLAMLHYRLKFGSGGGDSICNINSTFNCDAVSASRFSEFFGVPMAVWGVIFNAVLLLFIVATLFLTRENPARARLQLFLANLPVIGGCLVMATISLLFMKAYCVFCILTYFLSAVGATACWMAARSMKSGSDTAPDWMGIGKPVVLTFLFAFVAGFVAENSIQSSFGVSDELRNMIKDSLADWKSNPNVNPQPIEALEMGASAADAKLTIVEFADFLCPHCKHAAPVLHAFTAAHPDVRLLFQVWPLDGECNTSIPTATGTRCLLTRAFVCAQKKGQGWKAHEWLFHHQEELLQKPAAEKGIVSMFQELGLDAGQMDACVNASETKQLVEQQAAVGSSLKIQGTPSLYVNGRLLPRAQFLPILQAAYAEVR